MVTYANSLIYQQRGKRLRSGHSGFLCLRLRRGAARLSLCLCLRTCCGLGLCRREQLLQAANLFLQVCPHRVGCGCGCGCAGCSRRVFLSLRLQLARRLLFGQRSSLICGGQLRLKFGGHPLHHLFHLGACRRFVLAGGGMASVVRNLRVFRFLLSLLWLVRLLLRLLWLQFRLGRLRCWLRRRLLRRVLRVVLRVLLVLLFLLAVRVRFDLFAPVVAIVLFFGGVRHGRQREG